ncbi:DNA adenine methylase [Bifidobacterium cuniculi]|uniref:site-specific DNA-methyltransferase (adenine-specific) n=1 Tax=Bifidobacterium cuniculi TaxID=1688 RepID=A0A087B515_9BIFI|nr:DNA adenine methylase [Bifidobacterium cuniculi]KFI66115.1 phage protein [Bifidobacterium cuniculi]
MKYGLPYQGSKNSIAPWVVDHLPAAPVLVDIMAGGCAVTHCALLSGKFGRVIANDISDSALFFKEVAEGSMRGYAHVPTREEFHAAKDDDPAIGLLYSFASNRKNYLWSRALEPVKIAASRMLTSPSLHERRRAWLQFVRELDKYVKTTNTPPSKAIERLQRLQGLERLERLEGLEGLERLERLNALQGDYQQVPLPHDCVIYADPPYKDTKCGSYDGFDHNRFTQWLQTVEPLTIISEYTAPPDCTQIAERTKTVKANGYATTKTTERLFVPNHQVETYYARMSEGTLDLDQPKEIMPWHD